MGRDNTATLRAGMAGKIRADDLAANPRFTVSGIIGEGDASAERLGRFLAENPGPVLVTINSPGGDAFEGAAMLAELERHGAATVLVQGVAASAASLAVMGGARIVMHSDAMLMIHEPGAVTFGPAGEHRATAAMLDKLTGVYAAAYARATGHPAARVAAWMAAETWLTADESVSLNFADEIEATETPAAVARFDFTRFRNAPAQLVRMARANGWATVSPDAGAKEETYA